MSEQVTFRTGAEEVTWDLSDLYRGIDDQAISQDLDDADARADKLAETYRGKVGSLDSEEMRDLVEEYEAVQALAYKIGAYAYMHWSTNTEDPARGALLQKTTERGSRLSQKLLFVELEWANAPEDHANTLMNNEVLAHYRHWLETARRYRPYLLSEPEEKILAEKSVTGRSAWNRYFDEVHGAARYEWEGEMVPMQVMTNKLYDSDRNVRRRAAESFTQGLRSLSRTNTFIFNTLLADKASDDELRSYPNWLTSRNMANEVDEESVEALIQAVTSRYDIVERYYNLKRRLLGLDELFDYDRYAPLPAADRLYTWQEGRDIVLNAFDRFHPRIRQITEEFFDKRWIDAAVVPGKDGGAYCASVPVAHPYVLMNYEGKPRDVMVLAHELGHGVHGYLAQDRGQLQAHTPLTTAETASVFGEMLVFQDLLLKETDPEARLAMLTSKIEDTFATVFRQISMNRFEDKIHNARRTEGELTTERYSELWMETQREMFRNSVTMTDNYGIWWSYVPHFIGVPGYVYAYSFGNLLVLALYARYQEVGESFADGYIQMLAAGGSDWPHEIVKPLGIDLNDPHFWSKGLEMVDAMVKEAEAVAQQLGK